ncbi:hypothetical protein HYX13_00950 [Candidatus Woesearchaeota archaeon]|nr:hypothetical protein [Candidatus Woesearchaeota archaeon]
MKKNKLKENSCIFFFSKRGLAISQVFTFIVMILTFALIMLFGYKAIAGFLESGENIQFVQFKNELESSFQRIFRDYGSVRIEQFHLPPGYEQICFIDLDYSANSASEFAEESNELCQKDPIACTLWKTSSATCSDSGLSGKCHDLGEENVFLTPSAPVKIKVAKLSISPSEDGERLPGGFLCFPIHQGEFSLRLEGKGNHVEVAEALPEI